MSSAYFRIKQLCNKAFDLIEDIKDEFLQIVAMAIWIYIFSFLITFGLLFVLDAFVSLYYLHFANALLKYVIGYGSQVFGMSMCLVIIERIKKITFMSN